MLRSLLRPALIPKRFFRQHPLAPSAGFDQGRSVAVREGEGGEIMAYAKLRSILQENNVRETQRAQQFFERPNEKRRRRKKEKIFKEYLVYMKKKIEQAYALKRKVENEKKNYEHI